MTRPRPASLPMYDADRGAVEAWWRTLAAELHAEGLAGVPAVPDWPADLLMHWRDPDLLLSQACGLPLVTVLGGRVQVVGAFRYAAQGCSGTAYRSVLVVRDDDPARDIDDLRGRVAAVNDLGSHSGWNALRAVVAPRAAGAAFFGGVRLTGSHRASLATVRGALADLASIDCVTWASLARAEPRLLHGLRVLGWTPAAPGLPLVTGASTPPPMLAALRRALARAVTDPRAAAQRSALLIEGYEDADESHWDVVRGLAGVELADTASATPLERPRP